MSTWNSQANELFLKALELSAAARQAFLDGACAGDVDLRAEVESLLDAGVRAGSFLEPPAHNLIATIDEPAISEHPGTVIGPYKLLEQIGEGGFGVVYMAEQSQPVRRKVALKVLKPGMDTRQVVARFEAERQALALMDHPNIARILDGGATASGRPYFVMELVRGIPITEFCDQGQLAVRARLELFLSVCQAVQHAHQKGIIHRDLKPSNLLVTLQDGAPLVKVIDFGIAKALGQPLTDKTLFTNFTQLIGTPLYMSPEQAQISGLDVDTRSDVYSLGVLLYELLTGTTPLEKERLQTVGYDEIRRIIREEEPDRPSTRLSTLARAASQASANRHSDPKKLGQLMRGELDWIVMRALDKDRNRRHETTSAFAADVQRYLNDEPVQACPPTVGYRLGKMVRRHQGAVLAVALIVLALVGGIAGATWGLIRATDASADARNKAKQKADALRDREAALEAARKSERARTEQLCEALAAQARATRLSRRAGQRFKSLEILRQATRLARGLGLPAGKIHEQRNAAITALALPDLYLTGPWLACPANLASFDVDENHAVCAFTDWQGTCSIRRIADDVEIHRLQGQGTPCTPLLSRDGKLLALTYGDKEFRSVIEVQLWRLDGLKPRLILKENCARLGDYHPHAPQVALVYNNGTIGLFDLPSGRPIRRLAPDTITREVGIALHPTEPVVAVCSYYGSIVQLRDLCTGKVLATLPQGARPASVAWSPDGRTLAVGLAEALQVRLYDRATLRLFRTLETRQVATCAVFNHAGDRLAVSGWTMNLELFDLGTGEKLFATAPFTGLRFRFSRDDRRLAGAIQDGKLGILQVGDSREYRTLFHKGGLPPGQLYEWGTVSPDGRLLAVGTSAGFGLWDLETGSELAFVPTSGRNYHLVHFEPSGALLVLGPTGLIRWPIPKNLAAGGGAIGPPERLPLPRGQGLAQSSDGRVIVTCDRAVGYEQAYAGGWLWHSDRPGKPIRLDPGTDIGYITVSPDGKWVVTVRHQGGVARVWDARDGKLVKQLAEHMSYPEFSPDGCWLSTSLDGGRLLAVGTWECGPRIASDIGVFSPDSKLLAVPLPIGIRLIDPATGHEVALLEDPNLDLNNRPLFAPDGTRLIAVNGAHGVHVWDLRSIRQQLKELDLSWDWPDFPPADTKNRAGTPGRVEVLLEKLGTPPLPRAQKAPPLTRAQKAGQYIERNRLRVKRQPDNALACNDLAWVYATAPEPLRDVKAALPLAEKAVRLAPTNAVFRNTLGVTYYRAGRYREAVEVLRANLDRQADWALPFDLYFLAMSYQQLKETARARDYYAWADRWARAQRNLSEGHLQELAAFRSEAEEQLGIKKEK